MSSVVKRVARWVAVPLHQWRLDDAPEALVDYAACRHNTEPPYCMLCATVVLRP